MVVYDLNSLIFQVLQDSGNNTTTTADIVSTNASTPSSGKIDWAVVSVSLFLATIGITGNLLVIVGICILRDYKKSVTHWFILQLAVADLFLLLTLTFKVAENITGRWTLSTNFCRFKNSSMFMNYYASIAFLVIMSVDRFIAVCKSWSENWQKLRKPFVTWTVTVTVWIVACALSIPILLNSHVAGVQPSCKCRIIFPSRNQANMDQWCIERGYVNQNERTLCKNAYRNQSMQYCKTSNSGSKAVSTFGSIVFSTNRSASHTTPTMTSTNTAISASSTTTTLPNTTSHECFARSRTTFMIPYVLSHFIMLYVLPLLIMGYCYSRIVHEFLKKVTTSSETAAAERSRITIICSVLVTLFFVSWFPFHLYQIMLIKGHLVIQNKRWCSVLQLTADLIAYVSSCFNPYVYNFLGTNFISRIRVAAFSTARSEVNREPQVLTNQLVNECNRQDEDNNIVNPFPSEVDNLIIEEEQL